MVMNYPYRDICGKKLLMFLLNYNMSEWLFKFWFELFSKLKKKVLF